LKIRQYRLFKNRQNTAFHRVHIWWEASATVTALPWHRSTWKHWAGFSKCKL